MKKFVFYALFGVFVSHLLVSCYAFLKADRLVFTGTMAKRPVTMSVDSVYQTNVDVDE